MKVKCVINEIKLFLIVEIGWNFGFICKGILIDMGLILGNGNCLCSLYCKFLGCGVFFVLLFVNENVLGK